MCRPGLLDTAERVEAVTIENTRLRAALAHSDQPCVYCSLPADELAKCKSGFPGCGRADDALGCPELGASMRVEEMEARVEGLEDWGKKLIGERDYAALRVSETDERIVKCGVNVCPPVRDISPFSASRSWPCHKLTLPTFSLRSGGRVRQQSGGVLSECVRSFACAARAQGGHGDAASHDMIRYRSGGVCFG